MKCFVTVDGVQIAGFLCDCYVALCCSHSLCDDFQLLVNMFIRDIRTNPRLFFVGNSARKKMHQSVSAK